MKEKLKRGLAEFVYMMYQSGVLKNRIRVNSIAETIEQLVLTEKSLIRLGDGEIKLIAGRDIPFQKKDSTLAERLKDILREQNDQLLVALPDVFGDLSQYIDTSQKFWKEHMLFHRREYVKYCVRDKMYENAFFSRPYIMYKDKKNQAPLFDEMKKIWEGKDIVFVEGEISHNAVDVDFFDNAKKIERIICPSEQAWSVYNQIYAACKRISKEKLFLISLGATGKVLTIDLFQEGYRVLDIGSLDMEYGWFVQGAEKKCRVPKHEIRTREENIAAGYEEYLNQIIAIIN